jgi:hypothetical protein
MTSTPTSLEHEPSYSSPGLSGPAASSKTGVSFAGLLGVRGEKIVWSQPLAFLVALVAADLVWMVIQPLIAGVRSMPSWRTWLLVMIANVVLAGVALGFFRWIKNAAAAALVSAVGYVVIMTPLRWLINGGPSKLLHLNPPKSLEPLIIANGFLYVMLFMGALVLILPRMKPIWLALGIGTWAASLVNHVAMWPIDQFYFPGGFSWRGELGIVFYGLVSAALFAGVFWAGLRVAGFQPGVEAETGVEVAGWSETTGVVADLQRAANFRSVRKLLRPAGTGSVIFGVIAVFLGGSTMEQSPLNGILALIGVFLLVEGIWIIVAPSPAGMIVDGVALLILGGWNIMVTISNAAQGASGTPFFAVLGIWQIVWGFQSFGRYQKFARMSMGRPSEQSLKWVDETLKSLAATKVFNASDGFEFQAKISRKGQNWKAKLLPEMGVFVREKEEEVVITGKQRANIVPQGSASAGKNYEAAFQLGDRSFTGTISPESFTKFQQWKSR